MITKAAIYTRYSPGEDREKSATTLNQVRMCCDFAERNEWVVSEQHIYSDEYISGGSDERPAFQKMLADIDKGDFPGILIAKDTSRLARNELQAGIHKDWIRQKGIQIKFVLQDFGEGDEGWFTERQMDLIAELFRRKKSKEVLEHQKQNALQGYSNGGMPPYGYKRVEIKVDGKPKVTWDLEPEEAPVVRKVFTWHLEGYGGKQIARCLTKEGVRDRKGKPFAHSAILEWFKTPYRYAGYRCWNVRDKRNQVQPKSEWVMTPDAHPAIITTAEADEVYEMSQKRRRGHQIQERREYLLTGLLVCDVCAGAFQGDNHKTKNKVYYRCALRRRRGKSSCENQACPDADKLDRLVIEQVLEDLTNPDVFRQWMEDANRKHWQEKQGAIRRAEILESELEDVNQQLESLVDALARRTMPIGLIEKRINALHDQKLKHEAELHALKLDEPPVKLITEDDFRLYAELLREALQDTESCRQFLQSLIKRIRVHPDGEYTLEYFASAVCAQMSSATGNRTPV